MQTIVEIITRAGGWHPGLYLKIDNPPYMELVIEAMDESGPYGRPAVSVCHYGTLNGDAMRDPEMCCELTEQDGKLSLDPFYWRNDYAGVEQYSRFLTEIDYIVHRELYTQHMAFAALWDRNLREQGFADTFDVARHVRG